MSDELSPADEVTGMTIRHAYDSRSKGAKVFASGKEYRLVMKRKSGWIELVLIDTAGQPQPDIRCTVTLPDGSQAEGTSDATGVVRVETKTREGACSVSFQLAPDRWIELIPDAT